ncbi:hypothetical protein [Streptomyces sp. NPDC057854]|uniref:hypothetical protein n=1 Tax=unclassified Streptomyces TaxID=2593676 RepID=UPI0036A14EB5
MQEEMLKFLAARIEEDRRHMVGAGVGGSHLELLDSITKLTDEYRRFPDPWDERAYGLLYALRILARTYATHPDYQEEQWHP